MSVREEYLLYPVVPATKNVSLPNYFLIYFLKLNMMATLHISGIQRQMDTITLIVGEEVIQVRKEILFAWSKVFEVMFTCGMRYFSILVALK